MPAVNHNYKTYAGMKDTPEICSRLIPDNAIIIKKSFFLKEYGKIKGDPKIENYKR